LIISSLATELSKVVADWVILLLRMLLLAGSNPFIHQVSLLGDEDLMSVLGNFG
jgi:hypothetical protein